MDKLLTFTKAKCEVYFKPIIPRYYVLIVDFRSFYGILPTDDPIGSCCDCDFFYLFKCLSVTITCSYFNNGIKSTRPLSSPFAIFIWLTPQLLHLIINFPDKFWNIVDRNGDKMIHAVRKGVVGAMCGQRRPRSACADAQADLGLRCLLTGSLYIVEYTTFQLKPWPGFCLLTSLQEQCSRGVVCVGL